LFGGREGESSGKITNTKNARIKIKYKKSSIYKYFNIEYARNEIILPREQN